MSRRPSKPERSSPIDRSASLDALFLAGKHHDVLARTWDSADASFAADEAPFVVGSLALLGRLDEALAFASERASDPRTDAAIAVEIRFFGLVGLCHTGRYVEALSWARANAAHARAASPRTRFFVYQGIALVRYFTGRIDRARLASRRSLEAAVAARFQLGRLLALDLRGHVLVQRGEISAGLRVLDQAARLAESLGSTGHAAAIQVARLSYESQHGRKGDDLDTALEHVAAGSRDNVYALRAAWLELAFRRALEGNAPRARDALERVSEHALPESDYRARVRFFVALALVSRLDRSRAEVKEALAEARRALAASDHRILSAELSAWSSVLDESDIDVVRAHALEKETGSFAARVLVALREGTALGLGEARESPLWGLLTSRDPLETRVRSAIERGWLGLVPVLAGSEPGRHAFFCDGTLIADDRGLVRAIHPLPAQARELWGALRRGERSKEQLMREVWRIGKYAPRRHDSVVHTAIGRLRRELGPLAEWIRTTADGYALPSDVDVIVLGEAEPDASPREMAAATPVDDTSDRIVEALSARPLRSTDLAERLGLSEATVLRRLRELAQEGRVIREGAGKGTRYRSA